MKSVLTSSTIDYILDGNRDYLVGIFANEAIS